MEANHEFDHIPEPYRAMVAKDLLAHLTGKKWDWVGFNPLNDYHRHLYALFLRLSGQRLSEVWVALFSLSEDVSLPQRHKYVDDVVHSQIVGFPQKDGSLIPIPAQKVEV